MIDLNRPLEAPLESIQRVHFIGIAGAGLSALAKIMLDLSKRVSGSDLRSSEITQRLEQLGATVEGGHQQAHLPKDADLVVISSAIPEDNAELQAAIEYGIPIIKQAALLGALMTLKPTIAVAGSHGKTTTSAMIAVLLTESGLDPAFVLGGESIDLAGNARYGEGPFLVAEADEYDAKLPYFKPHIAVVTNIEPEHLDSYGSEAALLEAFHDFLADLPADGTAVLCADDANLRSMLPGLVNGGVRIASYGMNPEADWQVATLAANRRGGHDFTISRGERSLGPYSLSVPGEHNVLNAAAAAVVAQILDLDQQRVAAGFSLFRGTRRRLEEKGSAAGIVIIDDYAHHPTEVRASLAAVRQRFSDQNIVVAFQPHLYSRTRTLMDDFATSFGDADEVFLYDIYPAREENQWGVSSEELARRIGPRARYVGPIDSPSTPLIKAAASGGCIITMGAGDIDQLAPRLLRDLAR